MCQQTISVVEFTEDQGEVMDAAVKTARRSTNENIIIEGVEPESPLTGHYSYSSYFLRCYLCLLYFLFFRRMGQGGGVLKFW